MFRFLPRSEFKWIDPKEFDLNKYTSNSLKGCFFEVDLEYPRELRELTNDYPLAPDKTEIKGKLLSELQKLNNNSIYRKAMENLRNIIDGKLVNNEKDYLKRTSKLSYMLRRIFDNNLVVIHKSKLELRRNKPAQIGICILELIKVLMY